MAWRKLHLKNGTWELFDEPETCYRYWQYTSLCEDDYDWKEQYPVGPGNIREYIEKNK